MVLSNYLFKKNGHVTKGAIINILIIIIIQLNPAQTFSEKFQRYVARNRYLANYAGNTKIIRRMVLIP